ncbi:MAG: LysM peptidoglycan-binding domain-containing protein [Anaerolineae bacterium]
MKNSKTLRLFTFVTLLVTLFGIPSAPVFAADPVVKLVPASSTVDVGDQVVVSVMVEDVTNLFGVEFHITFDPNIVEVVDADAGTAEVQVGFGDFLSPDFVAQNEADNTTGVIDFAISQMPTHGPVSGSGTLATITFKGRASGTSDVAFSNVLLADSGGAQIPASAQNASVTVPGEATPPPTTTTPPPTTTTPPPCGTIQGYHVVRAGESLYSIGRAYATKPSAIATQNGIVNPNRIYVGMKLAIPVAPWSPIPPGPVAVRQFTPGGTVPTPPPSTGCRFYHTVRRGDTLTAIAVRYGSSIYAIGRANKIYNLNLIFPGQVLCIP